MEEKKDKLQLLLLLRVEGPFSMYLSSGLSKRALVDEKLLIVVK